MKGRRIETREAYAFNPVTALLIFPITAFFFFGKPMLNPDGGST